MRGYRKREKIQMNSLKPPPLSFFKKQIQLLVYIFRLIQCEIWGTESCYGVTELFQFQFSFLYIPFSLCCIQTVDKYICFLSDAMNTFPDKRILKGVENMYKNAIVLFCDRPEVLFLRELQTVRYDEQEVILDAFLAERFYTYREGWFVSSILGKN